MVLKRRPLSSILHLPSALVIALTFTLLCQCSPSGSSSSNSSSSSKIRVATTTTMVTDLVRSVGGDDVIVLPLMGPGVDPHLYKPSSDDTRTLQTADLIMYSGLMLEGRMADLFSRMGRTGRPVYAVTEALSSDDKLEPESFEGHWDPHIWGDASLWAKCVSVAVKALAEVDPDHAEEYEARGDALEARYLELHQWARERASSVPEEKRVLVTSHDAFNYFGRAYGFDVIGVQGISTVSEAGLADIGNVIDYINRRGVPAVFVETSVSPAAIERISRDTGAKIGGELFSDAMGTPGDLEEIEGEEVDLGTYEGMLKHNVHTVVQALIGESN